jgi:hypothetical protein
MLVLVFSAAMLTVYARFAWVTCIEHVTHKRITTNNKGGQKLRWWKAVTLYEMRIFIALLIYIGIAGTSNISGYWDKDGNAAHKLVEFITFFRFEQIKRYFHVSAPPTNHLPHSLLAYKAGTSC